MRMFLSLLVALPLGAQSLIPNNPGMKPTVAIRNATRAPVLGVYNASTSLFGDLVEAGEALATIEPILEDPWLDPFTRLNRILRQLRIRKTEAAPEIDRALQGMVAKGWLKPNAAGTWYFLTERGAEQVKWVE